MAMFRISLLIALAAVACICNGQTALMRDVFRAMPDSLLPYLTQNNKLDMLDFIDAGMEARVTNKLDGQSTLDTLTNDYVSLTLSPATKVQMRLLPQSTSATDTMRHVVCVATQLGEQHTCATIGFYSSQWLAIDCGNPLELALGSVANGDGPAQAPASGWTIAGARLPAANHLLTVELLHPFMPNEQGEVAPPLRRIVKMEWNGQAFEITGSVCHD